MRRAQAATELAEKAESPGIAAPPRQFTGWVGLAAFVLIFFPVVGTSGQEPGFDGDAAAIQTFFRSIASPAAELARFVLLLGLLAFAWFVVGLAILLSQVEGRLPWRAGIAAASGLLFVASAMNGYWQAAAYRVEHLSPELASYAFDLGNLQFANGWVSMGSFAAVAGWVVVRTHALPRWLGWTAIVAGLGLAASRAVWTSDFWLLPYAVFWVWVVVTSILLIRTGRRPAPGKGRHE